jgi:hypothetical protein
MNYNIAIPSYQRSQQLREKTLLLLYKHKIPLEKITIFVANEAEHHKYQHMLKSTPYDGVKLIVGVPGMGAVRNFIRSYYPVGTRVFHMDDDLVDILRKKSDKVMLPVQNLETEVILRGFEALETYNANIFGIYAAANPMFMKHKVSVGLYYCIGSCWGNINRHDQDLFVTMDDKEDFERSLQYYVKDGRVVRLDDITAKTKYYGVGGMQEKRTEKTILEGAETLVKRYPGLCKMYIRESTGHAELRLRDTR